MNKQTAIVNILSFSHAHAESLFSEGLWGFPDDRSGNNKRKWMKLEAGDDILLYGEYRGVKGIWILCTLLEKRESREPVRYWKLNPTGYPWQIKLAPVFPIDKFQREKLDYIEPIRKDELASLGIKIFRQKFDRWSIILVDENIQGQYNAVKKTIDILRAKNERIVVQKPDHDLIKKIVYQIGEIQNRFPATEYTIENKRIDVIWRRTPKSMPSVAFEVQIGGNIFEALSKLKHAFDLWNSIPVLVTTNDQIEEAKRWIEGSFHELKHVFRILSWQDVTEFYEVKQKAKDFEKRLGIV
ncbi:MAG: hypothetical protein NXY59_02890 [Aigarchaeota archaeon]|nr:hypothetical protein [Candidatus Pelearchaeum maunauluense]